MALRKMVAGSARQVGNQVMESVYLSGSNYCKSPAHARSVLNKLTKDATKVFEKRTLTTGRKKTGERIVVTFTKNLIKRPEMIFWTNGSETYEVESESFAHALVFEKRFRTTR